MKYNLEIEYDSFFKIISGIYDTDREHKELESFEKDLLQQDPHSEMTDYRCVICKTKLDKQTFEFSNKNFNKPLCPEHQGTENHRNLFFALKKRNVPCEFEAYDGFKFVDIAIHEIKLYIEVGETLNPFDAKKFLADLKNDRFTSQGGYQTRRLNDEFINEHLDELADTLKEVYIKAKIF